MLQEVSGHQVEGVFALIIIRSVAFRIEVLKTSTIEYLCLNSFINGTYCEKTNGLLTRNDEQRKT
jgi:hypothetical protein